MSQCHLSEVFGMQNAPFEEFEMQNVPFEGFEMQAIVALHKQPVDGIQWHLGSLRVDAINFGSVEGQAPDNNIAFML
eukprot:15458080-Alexandrium_andersonii.AAC.1